MHPTSRRGGDGRLTLALDPQDQGPQDACGVFGVWAPGEDVAKLTYFGLYALQHRGQESAGIAVSNGRQILVYKDMGLVSQVFDESTLSSLVGHIAIGHCRYSTTGSSTWKNAQPTFRASHGGSIALGHNGNLINTHELKQMVEALPKEQDELDLHLRQAEESSTNDTGLVTALLAHHPDTTHRAACARGAPPAQGRLLVRLDERGHRVRRPRPAGHPPPGPGSALAWLGRRQRGRRPGHGRRQPSSVRSSPAS